jgi:hypothetical protein
MDPPSWNGGSTSNQDTDPPRWPAHRRAGLHYSAREIGGTGPAHPANFAPTKLPTHGKPRPSAPAEAEIPTHFARASVRLFGVTPADPGSANGGQPVWGE